MKEHHNLYELLQEEDSENINEGSSKKRKIEVKISADEVINACVDLVTTEGRPFALLDCKPFRTLIEPIFAGLNMNVINSHNVLNMSQNNLKKPFIDIITRWNSTYNMLERLIVLKNYCDNEHDCQQVLNSAHWINISELIKVLAPMKIASLKLQVVQLPLGDFVKIWWELKLDVKSMASPYSDLLHEILENRERLLLENDTILSAIFLDPRLRKLLNVEKFNRAKFYLRNLCKQLLTVKKLSQSRSTEQEESLLTHDVTLDISNNDSNNNSTSNETSTYTLDRYLDDIHTYTSSFDEGNEDCSELQAALLEIETYKPKRLNLQVNILHYWIDERFKRPFLSQLALAVHNVPATQVSVERAFSALKFILSDMRTNINENNLENILLLKLNTE